MVGCQSCGQEIKANEFGECQNLLPSKKMEGPEGMGKKPAYWYRCDFINSLEAV